MRWAFPTISGWDWKSKAGILIVRAGRPIHPDNLSETLTYLLYMATGRAPDDPARTTRLRPQWLFGQTVHEGCDRAGYHTSRATSQPSTAHPRIVKLGCWGPVEMQRAQTGLDQRRRVVRTSAASAWMHHARLPGTSSVLFMDEPPGGKLSTTASGLYGSVIRNPGARDHRPHCRQGTALGGNKGKELTTGARRTWQPPATIEGINR